MDSSRKQRILTGALFVPAVLAAIFGLPSDAVFLVSLTVFVWAADEMLRIARHWAPSAPLKILLVLIPLEATALAYLLRQEIDGPSPGMVLVAVGLGGLRPRRRLHHDCTDAPAGSLLDEDFAAGAGNHVSRLAVAGAG